MNKFFGFLLLLLICTACAGTASTKAAGDLPLEQLVIEPGERVRLQLPPDPNTGPAESDPQASIEFVITDAAGKPVHATVSVDGQVKHRDVSEFVLVMPDPSRQSMVKVSAPGYEPWGEGLRFQLKHTRRFQFPVVLQSRAF